MELLEQIYSMGGVGMVSFPSLGLNVHETEKWQPGWANNDLEYSDISYTSLYQMCANAIYLSNSWLTSDNYVSWELLNESGALEFKFSVYPTNTNWEILSQKDWTEL
jgi:hypothetical protein